MEYLVEISNQIEQFFLPFPKVNITKYLSSIFNSFVAPCLWFVL